MIADLVDQLFRASIWEALRERRIPVRSDLFNFALIILKG